MSGGEILVIIIAIYILFGTKKLPEIARALGKGIKEIRKATDEIKREISESDVGKDIKDIENNLRG